MRYGTPKMVRKRIKKERRLWGCIITTMRWVRRRQKGRPAMTELLAGWRDIVGANATHAY